MPIVYILFMAIFIVATAELRYYDRDCMATKASNIYYLALTEKVC